MNAHKHGRTMAIGELEEKGDDDEEEEEETFLYSDKVIEVGKTNYDSIMTFTLCA